MPKFLASGRRRDIVTLIESLDEPREQAVKRALEEHYGERIPPREFYGAVEALVENGFVTRTQDGVHDRLQLTEAGTAALLDHVDWMNRALDR